MQHLKMKVACIYIYIYIYTHNNNNNNNNDTALFKVLVYFKTKNIIKQSKSINLLGWMISLSAYLIQYLVTFGISFVSSLLCYNT